MNERIRVVEAVLTDDPKPLKSFLQEVFESTAPIPCQGASQLVTLLDLKAMEVLFKSADTADAMARVVQTTGSRKQAVTALVKAARGAVTEFASAEKALETQKRDASKGPTPKKKGRPGKQAVGANEHAPTVFKAILLHWTLRLPCRAFSRTVKLPTRCGSQRTSLQLNPLRSSPLLSPSPSSATQWGVRATPCTMSRLGSAALT